MPFNPYENTADTPHGEKRFNPATLGSGAQNPWSTSGVWFDSALRAWGGTSSGSAYDYAAKAGDLWLSSAVLPCINWIRRVFPEAPLVVKRRAVDEKGKPADEVQFDHPLAALCRKPNTAYNGNALWAGTILSLIVDGNAYWFKVRDNGGKVRELWYVPHFCVEPAWSKTEFLTHYEYRVSAGKEPQRIDAADVVHYRVGIDPANLRKGLSPLAGQTPQVAADNEGNAFTTAILANMGIPGMVIAPPPGERIDRDSANAIKEAAMAKTQGSERGKPLVFPVAVTVNNPGFSPEQLALKDIRTIPEARILAAIGLNAQVLGFTSGEGTKTYANYGEARQAAWEECVVPMMTAFAAELDNQLLSDPIAVGDERAGTPGDTADEWCHFLLTSVRALQEDEDKLYTRLTMAVGGPWLRPNEARARVGLDPDTNGDTLYTPSGASGGEEANPGDEENERAEQGNGDEEEKPPRKAREMTGVADLAAKNGAGHGNGHGY